MTRTLSAATVGCLIFTLAGATCSAGILASSPSAIVSGSLSVSAVSGPNVLDATLDYAVFSAADFNAAFGGQGYSPTGPLVYTYQLINGDPSVPITTEIIGITNNASGIGTFDLGGATDVDASSSLFAPDARWIFDFPPGVAPGNSTYGLAFSSTNLPEFGNSLTISLTNLGGISAFLGNAVPTPGAVEIPEPTAALLAVAIGLVGAIRRRS